jgi:hypothetical protein
VKKGGTNEIIEQCEVTRKGSEQENPSALCEIATDDMIDIKTSPEHQKYIKKKNDEIKPKKWSRRGLNPRYPRN